MNDTPFSLENSWVAYAKREKERLKKFRHALPETVNSIIAQRKIQYPQLHKLGTDFSVPDQYFNPLMELYYSELTQSKLEYVIFGHIGDNHVHVNVLPNNPEELALGKKIYERIAHQVITWGGTVSAEHGIGKMKHHYLEMMYGENGIAEMKKVKKIFDPHGLLNRGNMFDLDEVKNC
ncbi:MAG: FAD-binding oxidoreductase, partial [Spirochaetes bacterium]|nr:FAD-binding oxidoreductase [Spirochaetota bacterium]